MHSLAQILSQAQSPLYEFREQASQTLGKRVHENASSTFNELSCILQDASYTPDVRRLSGIYIKNEIFKAWDFISLPVQNEIKKNCLASLACSDKKIVSAGASAVSAIGLIELPKGRWREMLEILLANAHNVNALYRETSLLTLSYLCEEISPEILSDEQKNQILTATMSSISLENMELAARALEAFKNSIKFYARNFKDLHECKRIFDSLYGVFSHFPELVLGILCEIMVLYPESFNSDLCAFGTFTFAAIKSQNEAIALLGIEVWNLAGDAELERLTANADSLGFLETACEALLSILLPYFSLPVSENSSSIPKAAHSTVAVLFQVCRNRSSKVLYAFINENIWNEDMKNIQAGLMALMAVFEDESFNGGEFCDFVERAINLLDHSKTEIQQQAIWCVSKIVKSSTECLTVCLLNDAKEKLMKIIERNRENVEIAIWAFNSLIEKHSGAIDFLQYEEIISKIVGLLMRVEQTEKIGLALVLGSVFDNIPEKFIKIIEKVFRCTSELYQKVTRHGPSSLIPFVTNALQLAAARCDFLIDDAHVDLLLNLAIEHGIDQQKAQEESLLLIGSIAMNIGPKFHNFLPRVLGYLGYAITQLHSIETLTSGLLALGDIMRALGSKMDFPMDFFPLLMKILENSQVPIACKISCIDCLGDFASSISDNFLKFLPTILEYLDTAAGCSLTIADFPEDQKVFTDLQESILRFYISLIQGLCESGKKIFVAERIQKLCKYIHIIIGPDYFPTEPIHEASIELIGDIIHFFKEEAGVSELFNYVDEKSRTPDSIGNTAKRIKQMMYAYS